jgi:hypothetical protein
VEARETRRLVVQRTWGLVLAGLIALGAFPPELRASLGKTDAVRVPAWMRQAPASSDLFLRGAELDAALQDGEPEITASVDGLNGPGAPRRWWPVVLSAVIPGVGELSTGHFVRGGILVAADAGMLYGAKKNHDQGNDIEAEYKAFADEHYSEEEGTLALARGDLEDYFGGAYPPGTTPDDVALYVTKEEDEREWYENIGKWDVFAWGWREYWQDSYDPSNPYDPSNIFMTPLREQYVAMRGKSNDAFDREDRFLVGALLLRVFSMLQMAYLEGFIGGRYSETSPSAGSAPRSALVVEPRGLEEARLGWRVTY